MTHAGGAVSIPIFIGVAPSDADTGGTLVDLVDMRMGVGLCTVAGLALLFVVVIINRRKTGVN